MPLNKSKGNMYKFITHTWNPIGGKCYHNCSYCSTKKLKNRFPVLNKRYSGKTRLIEKELKTNFGKDKFIFAAAQNDLFSALIPDRWIKRILEHCDKFDNKYLFQTKNPYKFLNFINEKVITKKSIFCTTIETNRIYNEIIKNAPYPSCRAGSTSKISEIIDTYVTIEPIIDFDLLEMLALIKKCNPKQVNIGADSGGNNLPEPTKEKILQLISELQKFTKVIEKENLKRLITAK